MDLPYTICFCRCAEQILMLYRNSPPNRHRWNGLGGKIQLDETPLLCIQREMIEEAGIDLQRANHLHFAGIVTWNFGVDPTRPSRGMYSYIAELPGDWETWEGEISTSEGILAWKPLSWVCDRTNPMVVSNIPLFLPHMLSQTVPCEYSCYYQGEQLIDFTILPYSPAAQ